MPSLVELFNRQKRDIDKIIETSFFRLMESEDPINQIAPIVSYPLRKLLMMKFNHSKPTIGSIIAEGQEVPLSRARAVLTEELLSDCKIGKAYGFTAKHYELLEEMNLYLQVNGRAELATQIEQYFFGIFADIAPQIINRLTMMMFRVMTTGTCSFQDPVTGAQVALTYPDTVSALLPSALAGGALWSAAATANGLQNLRDLTWAYYQNHGKWPDRLIMRQFNLRELSEQTSTKAAYLASVGGTGIVTADTNATVLNEAQTIDLIKRWCNVSDVMMFDAIYSEEAANGAVTNFSYLTDGFVLFVDDGVFERSLVPTVENGWRPGVFAVVEQKSRIPLVEQLAGVANGIPTAFDARKICAQRVSTTAFSTGTVPVNPT